jgi:micrococcal nuclease
MIIAEGYGREYTYRTPHRYQDDFKVVQNVARSKQKGLWAKNACSTLQEKQG